MDYKHTGIVQRLMNKERISDMLDKGDVVIIGHIGFSPTGEIFHCRSEDVAVMVSAELEAAKLLFLHDGEQVLDESRSKQGPYHNRGNVHNLSLSLARDFEDKLKLELNQTGRRIEHTEDSCHEDAWKLTFLDYLQCAITASRRNVNRVHLVPRNIPGSIVTELVTRDGTGLMISRDLYEGVRQATAKDVPAILSLIKPLEARKILVTRPPSQVADEVDKFIVFERDGEVLACCQLEQYVDGRYEEPFQHAVEMCCVAVSESGKGQNIGASLLAYCMRVTYRDLNSQRLFVLTTRAQHWFMEKGFYEVEPEMLPPGKLQKYDFERQPKVYFMNVDNERSVDEHELYVSANLNNY